MQQTLFKLIKKVNNVEEWLIKSYLTFNGIGFRRDAEKEVSYTTPRYILLCQSFRNRKHLSNMMVYIGECAWIFTYRKAICVPVSLCISACYCCKPWSNLPQQHPHTTHSEFPPCINRNTADLSSLMNKFLSIATFSNYFKSSESRHCFHIGIFPRSAGARMLWLTLQSDNNVDCRPPYNPWVNYFRHIAIVTVYIHIN